MVWVNLLPWRARRFSARLHRWSLVLLLMLAVFLTILLPVVGQQSINARLRQVVERQLQSGQQLKVIEARAEELIRQRGVLQQQLRLQQRRQQQTGEWADFTAELARQLPETMWLSELNKNAQYLNLKGFCLKMTDVQALRAQLLQMPLFSRVQTGKLSRSQQGIIQFSLQAVLRADTAKASEILEEQHDS